MRGGFEPARNGVDDTNSSQIDVEKHMPTYLRFIDANSICARDWNRSTPRSVTRRDG
jgi:hypothetical protein